MSVSESRVPMRPVWDALQLGLAVHGRWNLNGMPGPNKSAVETVALFSPSWFSHPGAIEMCSKLLESLRFSLCTGSNISSGLHAVHGAAVMTSRGYACSSFSVLPAPA